MRAESSRGRRTLLRIETTNSGPRGELARVYACASNAYHILMRVHVNFETILLALPQHFYCVVHEFEVVLSTGGNPS